ncbi:MAG: DNRLRE domain-containing protein [Chloroflexota bacterium]|nr:DNRLRE domain-containing protein [Chloroflexota bacterium]
MITRRSLVAAALLAVIAGASPNPARAADPVVVGAGDIADCTTDADEATAALLDGIAGTVVTLGDNVYRTGTAAEFRDCYAPTWGRHLARTRPAAGNHDYMTDGAAGYFGYFGASAGDPSRGYYSYDLGTWHVVVLNSNCALVGGCGADSPQAAWLRADLTASAGKSVLAYWHHPRFSSGSHGGSASVQAFWEILYAAGADIVLNGHDHDYERFAPQDPWAQPDARFGIRQFVVGTGGTVLRARASVARNSESFASTHGVLRLTLRPGAYDWSFETISRSTLDRGTGQTHGAPPPRTTRTFRVTSDTYVDQARPNSNFGTRSRLLIDGDTGSGLDRHGYIRATVSGLTGTVDRAYLRLWVTNPTKDGPRVYPTTATWSGKTLTWRNRPAAIGPAASDAGRIPIGTWVKLDVTSIVRGNGRYGFLLRPTSADGLNVASLQSTKPPRLVVETVPSTGG